MEKITENHFKEYKRCQNMGLFNMLDYHSWSKFTTLSKDTWFKIISNYSELSKKFN